ncbi:DUF6252 family protein [Aequorivita echinoideorum]|uniref:Lipoprotein n=1 Tax=Aequorivita echinoideorum TaxID=1549647 RepID=A0ABS5S0C8_9FLAO|nr:DUF6252 family protein [Aequorivita echinoideorum]MBT0606679.1 hypothetical protein [Aequorivita echinoideorum]
MKNTTIAVLSFLWFWANFASNNNHVSAEAGLKPNIMKTFKKTFLVLMAVVAVSLTSCKKDDDGGDGGGAGEGTMTANVSGSGSFTSMEIATVATETTQAGVTTIRVQGSNAEGRAIVLTISPYEGTGTYEISENSVFTFATYSETDVNNPLDTQFWNAPYENSGVVGEIQISEKTDTNIKGTFNFLGKNPDNGSEKSITDGSFNVNFQ